ncbi:hypothetical protein GF351_05505 [Candidatus Woesearchaeota archaeon]|nr:hypothetical protein [Candidatus Woesearchaeota archaeon]
MLTKVFLIRAPRYVSALFGKHDSLMPPLAFLSLAAVLRENDLEVKIIDCSASKIGWKSIRKIIEGQKPDIIGIGEETAFAHEGLRLAELAKEAAPHCKIIAGGYCYSYMEDDLLKNSAIDLVVVGEGEVTFLELAKEMDKDDTNKDFSKIKGIRYKDKDGNIVKTSKREPIQDLDELPIPAYDLIDFDDYGIGKLWDKVAPIEHSRGCVNSCSFCILWKHFGTAKNKRILSCYRTKSAERTAQEVEILLKRYRMKTLYWCDGAWNINGHWNREFSQKLVDDGLISNWWIYLNADLVPRDEKTGTFKKMIDASGQFNAVIGVERKEDIELNALNKSYDQDDVAGCFEILKRYPSVWAVALYIVGIPDETEQKIKEIVDHVQLLNPDGLGLMPLEPEEGTDFSQGMSHLISSYDKDHYYDYLSRGIKMRYITDKQLRKYIRKYSAKFWMPKIRWKDLFGRQNSIVHREMMKFGINATKAKIKDKIKRDLLGMPVPRYNYRCTYFGIARKPEWYDL